MFDVQRLTYILLWLLRCYRLFLNDMFIDMLLKTRVNSHKLTEVYIDYSRLH